MSPDPRSFTQSSTSTPDNSVSLRRLLSIAVGARIFNDTGIQIFGPYLAAIASGLGMSIVSLGALNSLRSLMGLAAPVIGSIADNIGYRTTMRALLLLSAAGTLAFALSPNLPVAVVGLIIMGLGLFSFAPVLQAYMSAQIPYHRRSRGLGVLEYGWALAGILGLSLSGLLIDRFGWRAPFLVISAGLLVAFFILGAFPRTPAAGARSQKAAATVSLQWRRWPRRIAVRIRTLVQLESNARSAWAAMIVNALNVFAASCISFIYGAWLGREYNVTATQLGLVALFMGLAELSGSVLVSLVGDRLGKYRSILGSSIFAVGAYLLLPLLNTFVAQTNTLPVARIIPLIVGLVIARALFEISIVSSISLLSEQVPTQRGKVLTLATALVTSGVAAASVVGPLTYTTWGLTGTTLISAACSFIAAVLAVRWVNERR